MAHERRPDAVPVAQRDERRRGRDHDQRRSASVAVVLAGQREQRDAAGCRRARRGSACTPTPASRRRPRARVADALVHALSGRTARCRGRSELRQQRHEDQDHRAGDDQRRHDQRHARRRARGPAARVLVRGAAHVLGDVVERLRERDAELLGLQLRGDERAASDSRRRCARASRGTPGARLAPSSIWRSAVSISSPIGPPSASRHAPQRGAVAEAGAHGHGEDVEEVGQVALDPLLAQPPLAREPDVGPEPADAPAPGSSSSGELPASTSSSMIAAEQRRERRLQPDEALHGEAGRAAGEVEPARERLALAAADRRRHARPEPRREAARRARATSERAARRRPAGAAGEPVERPAVEHASARRAGRRATHSAASAPASSAASYVDPRRPADQHEARSPTASRRRPARRSRPATSSSRASRPARSGSAAGSRRRRCRRRART